MHEPNMSFCGSLGVTQVTVILKMTVTYFETTTLPYAPLPMSENGYHDSYFGYPKEIPPSSA
jgi:hypothetical protein